MEGFLSQCQTFFKTRGRKSEATSPEEAVGFGVRITYKSYDEGLEEEMSALQISTNQELILESETGKTILSKVISEEQETALRAASGGEVSLEASTSSLKPLNRDNSASFWAIDCATLPWKPQVESESASENVWSVEDDRSEGTSDVTYLKGLFMSMFYNKDFQKTAAHMEKIQKSGCLGWDLLVTLLECKLHLSEDPNLDNKAVKTWETDADEIDLILEKSTEISTYSLIHLALEYVKSHRHYGAIILCRAVALRLPLTGSQDEVEWTFNLTYFLFVEMALRVMTVVKKKSEVSDFVLCCLNRLLNKMKKCVDYTSRDLDYITKIAEKRMEKIARCCNALAYLCNNLELFEGAAECCLAGLTHVRDERGLPVTSEICADLLVNLTLASMGRGEFFECKQSVIQALCWLRRQQDKEIAKSDKDEDMLERLSFRIQKAQKILDEFSIWNRKRLERDARSQKKSSY